MTFAERFSQLLQHLLRNLLQRRQSVWKALLWGAVTVVVIGFVAGLVAGGGLPLDLPPPTPPPQDHPHPPAPLSSPGKQEMRPAFAGARHALPLRKRPPPPVKELVG